MRNQQNAGDLMGLYGRCRLIRYTPAVVLIVAACATSAAEPPPAGPDPLPQPPRVSVLPPPADWVEEVIDGRTVVLSDGVRARILGLAAPGECWAAAATAFARETLLDKPVHYSRASESVISVRLPGNVDYATLAVSRGAMRVEKDDAVLGEAQKSAGKAGLGLWGAPCNGRDTTPAPTPPPAPPATTPPAPKRDCEVTYRVAKEWPGGFHAEVILHNTSQAAISPWEVRWTFPSGQRIGETWTVVARQEGPTVIGRNPADRPGIGAGGQLSFRFNAYVPGPNVAPSTFTLNGKVCPLR